LIGDLRPVEDRGGKNFSSGQNKKWHCSETVCSVPASL